MAVITVERAHQLGREAARGKAEALAERLGSAYGVDHQWVGDVLELKRSGADGKVEVFDDSVRVELKLNMLLSPMSGKIQHEIEKALDKYLA